jgi:hypothetical protein
VPALIAFCSAGAAVVVIAETPKAGASANAALTCLSVLTFVAAFPAIFVIAEVAGHTFAD